MLGGEARTHGRTEARREEPHSLVALSGPNIAAEIAKLRPSPLSMMPELVLRRAAHVDEMR